MFLLESHVDMQDIKALEEELQNIMKKIGEVPRLSSTDKPKLPDRQYFPLSLKKSIENWKSQVCQAVKRADLAIGFHDEETARSTSAIRKNITDEYFKDELEYVKTEEGPLFLNFMHLDYFKEGAFHADHLQPFSSIIERLDEMIETMNYDPKFAEEMQSSEFNDGYFLSIGDELNKKICGSLWLYKSYYNSMQNLWFLLASENSGSGKRDQDPVDWLSTFSAGREYIQYLESHGKFIDKKTILYTVQPDGRSLKESLKNWIIIENRPTIKAEKRLEELRQEVRKSIEGTGVKTTRYMEGALLFVSEFLKRSP